MQSVSRDCSEDANFSQNWRWPVDGAVGGDPGDEDAVGPVDAVPFPDVEAEGLTRSLDDLDEAGRSIRVLLINERVVD